MYILVRLKVCINSLILYTLSLLYTLDILKILIIIKIKLFPGSFAIKVVCFVIMIFAIIMEKEQCNQMIFIIKIIVLDFDANESIVLEFVIIIKFDFSYYFYNIVGIL